MKDWPRYAQALDMRLEGAMLQEIGDELGVSKERARQMVAIAKAQLAFRVFKGLRRPLPKQPWERERQQPLITSGGAPCSAADAWLSFGR